MWKFEGNIMSIRTRPPRVFGENNEIIRNDYSKAYGKEILR